MCLVGLYAEFRLGRWSHVHFKRTHGDKLSVGRHELNRERERMDFGFKEDNSGYDGPLSITCHRKLDSK